MNISKLKKKRLIGIKSIDKNNQYSKNSEMSEKKLVETVKIFFDIKSDAEILTNKMLPSFNEKFSNYYAFQPDITLLNYKLIFEYDGYLHYQHPFDIEKDRIKMQMIEELGYKRIRWPYFFQLTKEVAKFVFNNLVNHFTRKQLDLYSDEKFYKAINKIYVNPITHKPLTRDDYNNGCLFAPGFHTTEEVPSSFHNKGIKRFLDDMEWECNRKNDGCTCNGRTPIELKHQIIKSLNLYINDVDIDFKTDESRDYVILPKSDQRFNRFYNSIKLEDKYCNFFYPRERKN
jgi:hypothetical protein